MLNASQQILAGLGIHVEIGTFLVLFGLIFARMSGAIALTPFFGGRSIPGRVKVGLAVIVSMLLFPNVAPENAAPMTTILFACLLVKELVIGVTIGFMSQIVFNSIQMAGAMVDYGRGMSQATFLAPQLETNVSLLGQLQFQGALVLFLLLNGHLVFLRGMAASFQSVPLLSFPTFLSGTTPAAEQMAHYTAQSLVVALQLSAPALLALFLVDVSFGVLGRVASGLQVHTESQPVKAMVGLAIILLALAYIFNRMPGYFADLMEQIRVLMRNIV